MDYWKCSICGRYAYSSSHNCGSPTTGKIAENQVQAIHELRVELATIRKLLEKLLEKQ